MPNILLIRPGCTDFDEQQRLQGTLDLPLSKRGEKQLAQLLDGMKGVEIDLIYSAPSEPARSTAAAIGASRDVAVKEIETLHNLNQGLWQGLQWDEIRRKHPKVFKQWQESPESICPPGGETLQEAVERVRKALEKPLKKKGNLAIVAPEPLASVVRMVVRGTAMEAINPVCCDECGRWEVLRENTYKSTVGNFVPPELAAVHKA